MSEQPPRNSVLDARERAEKRADWKHYDGEHPYTRPEGSEASVFIQWKGTEVCLDFQCQCGANGHLDESSPYFVECPDCGAVYELGTQVIVKQVNRDEAFTTVMLDTSD